RLSSPRRITDPFPNWRSIWPRATSKAFSRSGLRAVSAHFHSGGVPPARIRAGHFRQVLSPSSAPMGRLCPTTDMRPGGRFPCGSRARALPLWITIRSVSHTPTVDEQPFEVNHLRRDTPTAERFIRTSCELPRLSLRSASLHSSLSETSCRTKKEHL